MASPTFNRRGVFRALGGAAAAATAVSAASAGVSGAAEPPGDSLAELTQALAAAPRRRAFTAVPLVADRPDLWDHEASAILLGYRGRWLQVWDSSDLAGPWLNLMREALNGQVFAHGRRDFLAVSATHGTAHLALFTQAMWDKYGLASRTGGALHRNTPVEERVGTAPTDDLQKPDGFYGPGNTNLATLQRRGAVFIACHDSIHAIARSLVSGAGRDAPSADAVAADLTNNLIPGVILVPSVVAYLVDLQRAGFTYAKAS